MWKQIEDVARLTAAVGGKHVVVIPEMWRDPSTGAVLEDRSLTVERWRKKTQGMNDLGRAMYEKYGVRAQYHPHADSHVDTCLLYTSPSPRDGLLSRMPSSA